MRVLRPISVLTFRLSVCLGAALFFLSAAEPNTKPATRKPASASAHGAARPDQAGHDTPTERRDRNVDPLVRSGFDHFYNVEYPLAIRDFQAAVAAAPEDPDRYNHLAQAVLFSVMYRAGALESQMVTGSNPYLRRAKMEPTAAEMKQIEDALERVMVLTDARLEKNENDVPALYARGAAFGLRGTYNYMIKHAWRDALKDVTQARKLHGRVVELDPSDVDARITQGFHEYMVGSLPWTYRMLGFLAGFRGDVQDGIRILQQVAAEGSSNKTDAEMFLAVIYRREKRPQDAIALLEELRVRYPRNFLVLFELSQMYADLGNLEKAQEALDRVEQLKKQNAPGFQSMPFERIEFARGNLLFWYDHHPEAIQHLRRASEHADRLDPHAGVMTWLRLGQCLDLAGHRAEAVRAYQAALETSPESDGAKESKKYLEHPYTRDVYLKEKT